MAFMNIDSNHNRNLPEGELREFSVLNITRGTLLWWCCATVTQLPSVHLKALLSPPVLNDEVLEI